METLYDLLGALQRDDADELRAAFRRAVKGTHPDIKPGDPEAAAKFREIIRANEILADPEQRAAYDHLLDLAKQEQRQRSKRALARRLLQVASGAVALSVVSGAIAGGYLASTQMPEDWSVSIVQVADAVRQSTETTAETLRQSTEAAAIALRHSTGAAAQALRQSAETVGAAVRQSTESVTAAMRQSVAEAVRESSEGVTDAMSSPTKDAGPQIAALQQRSPSLVERPETIELPVEAVAPSTATLQPSLGDPPAAVVGPPLDLTATALSAQSYRERGMLAFRNGDLNSAMADLDHAIQLDPKLAAAYIDRSMVFYRLQKYDRASADLARAKHIDKGTRANSPGPQTTSHAPTTAKKQPRSIFEATRPAKRRTANLDSSREQPYPYAGP